MTTYPFFFSFERDDVSFDFNRKMLISFHQLEIVRHKARECLKRSEEEIGVAALKRLRYGSWMRAPISSLRPRTDLNSGRDVLNANPGSSMGVVKETASVVQVREHSVNENREIEEELEVYGVSTVEQLARRKEMEMGLVAIGTDGLVNNDGSNVVGESDLAITKVILGRKYWMSV
ncbi:LOW QUALITY PROTEIN: hypothetical protein PanWU01x14_280270 [Parasponia andersonii]|uniref:Uncharacterized protein n=1 Tax=Parasponia andersonii TaxID=3476 RepID=A0A2P5B1I0_PARAD|nr:LOW QUALITY PROTEIN: hypothetical protein PanWU01x14_280270 [Parasponia andersonii]